MNDRMAPLEVRLWGDLACFTRPEMKAERVSYPVITPSAARGALEAVFWRPAMRWRIDEIVVLKPIRYISLLRNEVAQRQTDRTARGWAAKGGGYDASDPASRAQRHTLALRDVAYIVRAQIELNAGVDDDVAKYRDQFRRRVREGRCFATPYFGCREFAASFGEPEPGDTPSMLDNGELGTMLLDVDYASDRTGRGKPRFFQARLDNGVLKVPDRFAEVA